MRTLTNQSNESILGTQYNKIFILHAPCFKHCSYDHKPKWLGYYHNINYVGWKNLVRINQHYGSCYATYKLAIFSSRVCYCNQLATKFLLKGLCLCYALYITAIYKLHHICESWYLLLWFWLDGPWTPRRLHVYSSLQIALPI